MGDYINYYGLNLIIASSGEEAMIKLSSKKICSLYLKWYKEQKMKQPKKKTQDIENIKKIEGGYIFFRQHAGMSRDLPRRVNNKHKIIFRSLVVEWFGSNPNHYPY